MAYNDIEAWSRILAEEAEARREYDEACEENEKTAKELDEKEFRECGENEIDPTSLGIDECGDGAVDEDGLDETDLDEDGLDEKIDFSKYGLSEADMREPLTAASAALGRPASTADLVGQDAVRLVAEAIVKAAGALRGEADPVGKFLNEAGDGLPLDDADWKKIDAMATAAEKIKYVQDKCAGAELSPAAKDELAATLELLKGEEADAEAKAKSAEALRRAKEFYQKWLSDPDFREANSKPGEERVVGVRNGQKIVRQFPVTDPQSDAAKTFKKYFDDMTDLDREAFDGWAAQARRKFVAKGVAPREWDRGGGMKGGLHNGMAQWKGKDLHAVGGDGDKENPLAQHGFDQVQGAAGNATDDPGAGEDFYMNVDQDAQFKFSHEGVYKDILMKADAMARDLGLTQDELAARLADALKMGRITDTVLKKGKEGKPITDYQLEYIFQALDDKEKAELKAELLASLPWPKADGTPGDRRRQADFIDYLFLTGGNRRVRLQDLLKQYGIAGDQSGSSGAGTQNGDTIVYAIVCALAEFYNVMTDEAKELWAIKGMQNQNKDLRARNLEPRRYAKHLALKIMQDLFDELAEPGQTPPDIPQLPIENCYYKDERGIVRNSRKLKLNLPTEQWEDAQEKFGKLLALIQLKAAKGGEGAAEADGVFAAIKRKINQWNGGNAPGEKGERQARKLKTYLTDAQLAELNKLLEIVRADPALNGLDADQMKRLAMLEHMRFGWSEAESEEWFRSEMRRKRQELGGKSYDDIENGLQIFCQLEAKKFLDGASGNMTRDNIQVQAAKAAGDDLDEADFDAMVEEALGASRG